MKCTGQPFILLAEQTSCAESPTCTHIECYTDIACLLAGSLSPVISGCRAPDRDLFCICPDGPSGFWKTFWKMTDSTTIATSTTTSSHLTSGQKAGIAIGVIAFIILVAVLGFFVYRYLKGRRKNRGEYRPQFEELHHAKDLPYLQPPAVEGLI